uniref:uncharacterized protein n=1 Tax=Lonchura striata TaxID=40157 RepID=UPI000B4D6FF3|nr:uncharacterized protein LOC110473490 [Lonchura striata domestica]XP_021391734.1 uncharacterized protein LOC110473490 [Lonchura striata domestica]
MLYPKYLPKNTPAAEKMVPLVARSNRVDERGRGVKDGGGKKPRIGISEQCSWNGLRSGTKKPWCDLRHPNYLNKGKALINQNYRTAYASNNHHHLAQYIFFFLSVLCAKEVDSVEGVGEIQYTHEPFKWTLIRWEDQKTLQTIITPEAPSFTCSLRDIVHVELTFDPGFYFCPSSNPGKAYCNYPGHYYCGYWGCETIASDWQVEKPDKYLRVGWGPYGCNPPIRDFAGGISQKGNCHWIYINVTQPAEPGWFLGKTWGVRIWEPGPRVDSGGHILIRKERVPPDPELVGPNPEVGEPNEELRNQWNVTNEIDNTTITPQGKEKPNYTQNGVRI